MEWIISYFAFVDPVSEPHLEGFRVSSLDSPNRSHAHHEEDYLGDEHHQLKAGHLSDKIRQTSFALLVSEMQRS